jgi:hypothetical protein
MPSGDSTWPTFPVNFDAWNKLAIVGDGTTIKMYVNGSGQIIYTGAGWTTGTWMWVGTTTKSGYCNIRNFYWVSNRALTASEVSAL